MEEVKEFDDFEDNKKVYNKNIENNKLIEDFEEMNLKEKLLRGIYAYGFEKPTLIQSKTIPLITNGFEIIAQSQSGTGKTGAFVISVLNTIDETKHYPQGIIVTNTRELADQVVNVVKQLGKYMNISTTLCIGGNSVRDNTRTLRTSHIVVGTPGRIIDMIQSKAFDSKKIKIMILDEADELLKDEFSEQMKNIIQALDKNVKINIFSATLPDETLRTTKNFMGPETVELLLEKDEIPIELIMQYNIDVGDENAKLDTIKDLYNKFSINQCIIYTNSVKKTQWLKEKLEEEGHGVETIHGSLDNLKRTEIMKRFRQGAFRVLISTDLMGRGIDIEHVSYVINYDLPLDNSAYIHRIGRSGRHGKKGIAINFITKRDYRKVAELEKYYSIQIPEIGRAHV